MTDQQQPEVVIRLKRNGPIVIQGPVKLLDSDGNPIALPSDKPGFALCRCGHSGHMPFCDGKHRECGFQADDAASM